jgi:hypothetical protein
MTNVEELTWSKQFFFGHFCIFLKGCNKSQRYSCPTGYSTLYFQHQYTKSLTFKNSGTLIVINLFVKLLQGNEHTLARLRSYFQYQTNPPYFTYTTIRA